MQAERHNSGKLKWSLVSYKALTPMVKVLMFGANKYSADNWKKGLGYKELTESLLRHTYAFLDGENRDSESGELHVGHILCNAMFLSYMVMFKREFDNRENEK